MRSSLVWKTTDTNTPSFETRGQTPADALYNRWKDSIILTDNYLQFPRATQVVQLSLESAAGRAAASAGTALQSVSPPRFIESPHPQHIESHTLNKATRRLHE